MKISLFSRARGERASFEELLASHMEPLYRTAYRFSGNQHDAEDLVQDLLIKLYPRHAELLKVERLRPWLTRVLYNLYVDSRRSEGRSPIESGHDDLLDRQESGFDGPMQALHQESLQQRILQGMEQLGDDHRVLLILHDIESYTLPEVSEILGVPVGTLKSRLHRSRAKLKKILEQGTFLQEAAC